MLYPLTYTLLHIFLWNCVECSSQRQSFSGAKQTYTLYTVVQCTKWKHWVAFFLSSCKQLTALNSSLSFSSGNSGTCSDKLNVFSFVNIYIRNEETFTFMFYLAYIYIYICICVCVYVCMYDAFMYVYVYMYFLLLSYYVFRLLTLISIPQIGIAILM